MRPSLVAFLAVALAVAGCAGTPEPDALDSVFGEAFEMGNETAGLQGILRGVQLEGRIAEGPWGPSANVTMEVGNATSPPMASPNALGAGGETTALPGNITGANVAVRFLKAEALVGYTAHFVLAYDAKHLWDGNATASARIPAEGEFQATLVRPGPFLVAARLEHPNGTVAATLEEPFAGSFALHWTAQGEVQPQKPSDPSGALPWPTPREEMVDIYTLDLPEGVTVTATTSFRGTYQPSDGTDVDLGIYDPAGAGVVCLGTGGGGPTAPVDPAQATETVSAETDSSGTWSVQVGAMADGCGGGGGYQYSNPGPVPYTLDILVH